jgi:hypothetical protein
MLLPGVLSRFSLSKLLPFQLFLRSLQLSLPPRFFRIDFRLFDVYCIYGNISVFSLPRFII